MKSVNWKITISSIWLVTTFSLVTWWFIYVMKLDPPQTVAEIERRQRMIFWEGSTLLLAILVGGIFLILYVYRDSQRHERLRFFFANFTHDLKTSISRLRLQAEILAEGKELSGSKHLERLLRDLTRLDLQLENSLLLTHVEDSMLLNESLRVQHLVQSLQIEFEGLEIKWQGDAEIFGDSRALRSVFRNIFENAIRHGKATQVQLKVTALSSERVELVFEDNGQGTARELSDLGRQILPIKENDGNGIGLFLAKRLIEKMRGKISFEPGAKGGFCSRLVLKGHLT